MYSAYFLSKMSGIKKNPSSLKSLAFCSAYNNCYSKDLRILSERLSSFFVAAYFDNCMCIFSACLEDEFHSHVVNVNNKDLFLVYSGPEFVSPLQNDQVPVDVWNDICRKRRYNSDPFFNEINEIIKRQRLQ